MLWDINKGPWTMPEGGVNYKWGDGWLLGGDV